MEDCEELNTDSIFVLTNHEFYNTVCNDRKCGECPYCRKMLDKYFWLRHETVKTNKFIPFDNIKTLEKYIKQIHINRRSLHECFTDKVPLRIAVDLDDKLLYDQFKHTSENNKKKYFKLFNSKLVKPVKLAIKKIIETSFIVSRTEDFPSVKLSDYNIDYSNGWEDKEKRYKASAHIVMNYFVKPDEKLNYLKVFDLMMEEELSSNKYYMHDPLYKNGIVNIRTRYSHKQNSTRTKTGDGPFSNSFVSYVNDSTEVYLDTLQPHVSKHIHKSSYEEKVKFDGNDKQLCDILKRIRTPYSSSYMVWTAFIYSLAHLFKYSNDGMKLLDKYSKKYAGNKPDGTSQYTVGKVEELWNDARRHPEYKSSAYGTMLKYLKMDDLNYYNKNKESLISYKKYVYQYERERFADIMKYKPKFEFEEESYLVIDQFKSKYFPVEKINDIIKENNNTTIAIRSGMGTGKTYAVDQTINNLIGEHIHKSILLITHRKSLTAQISSRHKSFAIYYDIEGPIEENHVIIQIDSLGRLSNIRYEYIIIDEWIGVMSHMSNPGSTYIKEHTIDRMDQAMIQADHIIAIDAHMDDSALKCLYSYVGCKINVLHNKRLCNTEETIRLNGGIEYIIPIILEKLGDQKRVVIASTTLKDLNMLHKYILEIHPNKMIGIYTSETDDQVKHTHFSNVDEYWNSLDVLLYTTTCSEGISYDIVGFDSIFCCFSDNSSNAEIGQQLIHRVRQFSSNTIYMVIKHNPGNFYTTDIDELKDVLKYNTNFVLSYTKRGLIKKAPKYTRTGPTTYTFLETSFYTCVVETMIRNNMSYNDLFGRHIQLFCEKGSKIVFDETEYSIEQDIISTTDKSEKNKLKKKLDKMKLENSLIRDNMKRIYKANKKAYIDRIYDSKNVDDKEKKLIMDKQNRTVEEKDILNKYDIIQMGFKGKITREVVATLYTPKCKALYNMYKRFNPNNLHLDLKYEKSKKYKIMNNTDFAECENQMAQAELVMSLLIKFGFVDNDTLDINFNLEVEGSVLESNIKKSATWLFKSMDLFKYNFNSPKRSYTVKSLKEKTLKSLLQCFNPMLSYLGISIRLHDKDTYMYKLSISKYFSKENNIHLPFPQTSREIQEDICEKNNKFVEMVLNN